MRHVQTEVDLDLHARLLGLAKDSNMSLKNQIRMALEEFVKNHEHQIGKDPIEALIGSFEIQDGGCSDRDIWKP